MCSERQESVEEKPAYGLYVGYNVIATFLLSGVGGVILMVLGFLVKVNLNIAFWIAGPILIVVFLWPGIGMIFSNKSSYKQKGLRFDFLKSLKNAQILDCGCGTGRHAIPLAKQMSKGSFLTGIDIYDTKSISLNSLKRVQRNAELEGVSDRTKFIVGSVTKIPFDDEKFDVVTCMGVIHELGKHKSKSFGEIYRVLKPGGIFYFRELKRVAILPTIGIFALYGFKGESFWEIELENSGFKIKDKYKGGNYFEFLASK